MGKQVSLFQRGRAAVYRRIPQAAGGDVDEDLMRLAELEGRDR